MSGHILPYSDHYINFTLKMSNAFNGKVKSDTLVCHCRNP
ncbi:hypothetical protein Epro_0030 [Endomicrobium proavitum]|uniref:Uncharacterized protein n=1 Tax=Endomicrobium proavitum TaxID=1408281 RepID=A0A0G3WIT6_9BACT|nr:hypothetical protein Epro_0030 [Endomicrobium proavitum]